MKAKNTKIGHTCWCAPIKVDGLFFSREMNQVENFPYTLTNSKAGVTNLAKQVVLNFLPQKLFKMLKNKLKALFVSCLITVSTLGFSQAALDTIVKIEGKIMPVDVLKVTSQYVSFQVPGDKENYTMERKEIQKIIYKTGRVEEFNKPVFMVVDDYAWEAIWLTEDKKDVVDYYKRGFISASSSASDRSPKAAKKNATIRLQKKAVV